MHPEHDEPHEQKSVSKINTHDQITSWITSHMMCVQVAMPRSMTVDVFVRCHRRQRKLEEGLLLSGQFNEALDALLEWLAKVEPMLAEDSPVHGDLDTVNSFLDTHKVLFLSPFNFFCLQSLKNKLFCECYKKTVDFLPMYMGCFTVLR